MAKTTDMASVTTTKVQAKMITSMAEVSVNGMYSTRRRRHDVLPGIDHSVSLQGAHV